MKQGRRRTCTLSHIDRLTAKWGFYSSLPLHFDKFQPVCVTAGQPTATHDPPPPRENDYMLKSFPLHEPSLRHPVSLCGSV